MDARWLRPIVGLVVVLSLELPLAGQIVGPAVLPGPMPPPGNFGPSVVLANPPAWYSKSAHPVLAPSSAAFSGAAHPGVAHPGIARPGMENHSPRRSGRGPSHQQAVSHSENFIVFASDPQWASEVAQIAEQQRRDLAVYWLGQELPAWSQRCPLHVQDAENLGAGGETRFALSRGVPGSWMMSVQGTRQRILDSVLPHEITHTIFATHFGRMNKYVPRWADEGASTTVEHEAEKKKHRHFLHQFLKTGRGLAFNEMFRLKEYPQDILPLYAQGHSAVQFLLDQSGPRHFIQFIEMGMQTENWAAALQKFYGYDSIGDFQINWNQWLRDGSPSDLAAYAPRLRESSDDSVRLASGTTSIAPSPPPGIQQPLEAVVSELSPATTVAGAANPEQSLLASTSLSQTDSESWYKRKLHEKSGAPATTIPAHNHFSGDPAHGLRSSVSAASRPQSVQTPGIQVLDWGDSGRLSTSNANTTYR